MVIVAILFGCWLKLGKTEAQPVDATVNSSTTETTTETTTAETTTEEKVSESTTETTTEITTKEESTYAYAYAGFNPVITDTTVPFNRLLVNRDYILPENFKLNLSTLSEIGSAERLDSRVAPYYIKMFNAAKEDGIYLTPVSGYRTYDRQKTNFENRIAVYQNQGYTKAKATDLAAQVILPPGTSEHNAGLAMDIVSLETSFENTDAFKWLSENAADYGFILRYPKDKTDITKITYEPWHWRFVGVEMAKAIKSSGLTLEEYLGAYESF